jgi:hypothetical protein
MYRKNEQPATTPEKFELPFEGKLDAQNRWVIMAELIPWAEFEAEYASIFAEEIGAPAKSFRIAYSNKAPFEASMLVHFRERIGLELINKINRQMVKNQRESQGEENPEKKLEEEAKNPRENRGKLILDASCAPGDISYPTDLNLLNQARKQTEKIIDLLYEGLKGNLKKKPRTYRILARKSYLERDYKLLLVVAEIYRQQRWMYENKKQTIAARIISLSQPHIRPIVRGKVGKPVEFGAKLSASCFEGYVFLDHISWDNFNESGDFSRQVEAYYQYTGYYPESVHVDKIYRTRANRAWCKERGIRISGSPLGRPPKNVSKAQKKQAQEDERIRNCIEGKFGQGKRRFSLAKVMTVLPHTSFCAIAITFLVMNLSHLLRQVFWLFFVLNEKKALFLS